MARIRIGDLMVRAGLIDEMQLQAALAYQRQWGGRLGDILVAQGFLDEMMLWRGLSKQLDVPLVSLPEMVIPPEVVAQVPVEVAVKLELFPVTRDERTLTLATSEPNNIGATDEVAFRSGLKVKTVLAPSREIEWAIRTYYRGEREPCPPPRARRVVQVPEQPTPAPAPPPPVSQPPVPSLGGARTPLTQLGAQPGALPSTTTSSFAGQAASADAQLTRQTVDTLRAVIELCVARGVFTREELWQMMQALQNAPR